MKWIPFKTELPPLNEAILVLRQDMKGWADTSCVVRVEYTQEGEEPTEGWYLSGYFNHDIYNEGYATHWLKIPIPPLRKNKK